MNARRRAVVAGTVSLAALVAVGAPLVAQPGKNEPPGKGTQVAPGKGKPKFAPKSTTRFATLLGRNEIGPSPTASAGRGPGRSGWRHGGDHHHAAVLRGCRAGHRHPTAMHAPGRPEHERPGRGHPRRADERRPRHLSSVVDASELLQEITKHPIRFYVNIHTGDFKDGALRGQLHRAPWRR